LQLVTTSTGERQRVEPSKINVQVVQNDKIVLKHTLTDKCNGSYEIEFTPTELGKCQLNIDTYGKRTFEFPIVIGGTVDPKLCEAYVKSETKANEPVLIVVVAKDSNGDKFRVGGTLFSIGFAGDGDLYNVDLQDKMDGTYHISVTPNKPGNYCVFISVGEKDIGSSPVGFKVT